MGAPRSDDKAIAYPGAWRAIRGLRSLGHVSRVTEQNGNRVDGSTISNIENGSRQPSGETLRKVADAYLVDPAALGHVIEPGESVCTVCRGRGFMQAPVQAIPTTIANAA